MSGILLAAVVVGATGLFLGLFLGLADKKFKVEVDEKELAVRSVLPGNNCGGCGYAGCDGLAKAIAKGEAPAGACPVGGAPVAEKIGDILGVKAEAGERMTAFVKCAGDCEKTRTHYEYSGVKDCAMMAFVPSSGPKDCSYGCLGYGACVKACPFDAIHIIGGVAVVDKEACKACGKCAAACPRKLIELVPYRQKYLVRCSSKEKGKAVMQACDVGCIGCRKCEKVCESGAVSFADNLPHIDPEKCVSCGKCAEGCPRKSITGRNGE